ncbi:MAG: hypothetical protein M0R75_08795 [Dehalococcoidia bacterium]|nr:hypothetical protein [Dehalococcoidia bacterium]
MPDDPAGPRSAEPATDPDLVPRPSKMRYIAIFFAGILVGRVASANFAPGPLGALDLFMYIGLALSLAWAWRTWARRAMVQRHLDAERRRERQASTATAPSEATPPTPRKKRRRR